MTRPSENVLGESVKGATRSPFKAHRTITPRRKWGVANIFIRRRNSKTCVIIAIIYYTSEEESNEIP